MTVRVRKNGWMVDVRYEGARYRVAAPKCTSRRKAEAFERAVLADLRAGIDPRRAAQPVEPSTTSEPAPTVADYAESYLVEVAAAGQRSSTLENKRALFRLWVVPVVGHVNVSAIKSSHFATVRETMAAAGLSPGRINHALHLLAHVVRWYHDRRDLPAPHFKVGRVKGEGAGKAVKRWTDPEADRLVSAAAKESPTAHIAILLGLDAGMRLSETRALQWTDIDLVSPRPSVTVARSRGRFDSEGPTKGGKARHVPLTTRLADALRGHEHEADPHVLLHNGVPWKRPDLARLGRKVVKAAGIPNGGFHVLRHSFCSRLVERGVDLNKVRLLAGHKSLQVTQKYMHLAPGGLDTAIDALDR